MAGIQQNGHGNLGKPPYTIRRMAQKGMNNRKTNIYFASFLALFSVSLVWAAPSAPDPMALEQERTLKKDAEEKAEAICNSIFGQGRSNVLVNVELGLESEKKGGAALTRKLESNSGVGDEEYILPWVPAPKSVTNEEVPKDANVQTQAAQTEQVDVRTVMKRFDITVVYDEALAEDRVEMAKNTLASTFERYKGILKLYFRPAQFQRQDGFNPKEVVTKNLWDSLKLKNFLWLLLIFLGFYLMRFFFGPLAGFMKEYIEGMKDQARSKVEMENKSQSENETDANSEDETVNGEGELTEEELAALEAQEEEMAKYDPFSFVSDGNVKQLAYLLHHEEPWVVAMVISYLTEEHAFKVMEALPADMQAKVALETAMYRQTSEDQVRAIDADIKEKIDFVVGGLEKLVGILENSDRFSRDNILEYLKNEKPGLYERVRERILLFDDISTFPNLAMQQIVRELKTEELAKALRDTSPELQQKFFDNMSQGAVTLLREEMEFGAPVTPDQIEEERRKIVDHIKTLEHDGKIAFRQRGKSSSISGDEIGSDVSSMQINSVVESAQRKSAQASEAYGEGNAAMEQGDMAGAIVHFERSVHSAPESTEAQQALANAYYGAERYEDALATYDIVLQLQPNEELSTWVEQLRASISSTTS